MKKIISLLLACILSLSLVACSGKNNNETSKEIKTVKELVDKFQEAKLPVTEPKNMEAKDFGIIPKLTDDAMIFKINANEDQNARVFNFKNSDDLNKVKKAYNEMGKSSAMLFSHTYAKGNFLIQANGQIEKDTFEKYKKVLDENIK
ncbi:hypothetical protein HAHI6034_11700 [Hathewaya histolytica]|uniref:Lipoprotein n=1 Tax=Hathewaya histolytica TaxID=1498 RepID=A0A4U9RBR6_HATHI|nr:hypothetical protein [Hathewaya histolytica]VTQ88999.1 Uncharacterised protein [Hathewaya histolytica]